MSCTYRYTTVLLQQHGQATLAVRRQLLEHGKIPPTQTSTVIRSQLAAFPEAYRAIGPCSPPHFPQLHCQGTGRCAIANQQSSMPCLIL